MKMIRFSQTFWHVLHGASVPQFEVGKDYPVNEDTQRCVARGIAEEVEVPDEPAPDASAESKPEGEPGAAPAEAAKAAAKGKK